MIFRSSDLILLPSGSSAIFIQDKSGNRDSALEFQHIAHTRLYLLYFLLLYIYMPISTSKVNLLRNTRHGEILRRDDPYLMVFRLSQSGDSTVDFKRSLRHSPFYLSPSNSHLKLEFCTAINTHNDWPLYPHSPESRGDTSAAGLADTKSMMN